MSTTLEFCGEINHAIHITLYNDEHRAIMELIRSNENIGDIVMNTQHTDGAHPIQIWLDGFMVYADNILFRVVQDDYFYWITRDDIGQSYLRVRYDRDRREFLFKGYR